MSCSALSFHYYGLSGASYDNGVLLGPTEKDDLPFSKCAPTTSVKNPCVVLFVADFYALKQEYEDTKQKLVECEKK